MKQSAFTCVDLRLEIARSAFSWLNLPGRASCMVQSWYNAAAKTLHFPVFPTKHRSINLQFIFARAARAHSSRTLTPDP